MNVDISRLGPAARKQILEKLREKNLGIEKNSGNKLHAEKTDGYASKKEANRAAQLRIMERAGEIRDLREQVKFELTPTVYEREDGCLVKYHNMAMKKRDAEKVEKCKLKLVERPLVYLADFAYTTKDGKKIVEDVKGYKGGATYRIFACKRKIMLEKFGIRVVEV